MTSSTNQNFTIISLGSNARGCWGTPEQTIDRAIVMLRRRFRVAFMASRGFVTKPIGSGRQSCYLNMVAAFRTTSSPAAMLRFFKKLEQRSGRRTGTSRRWGPRSLDIDIIDCGGRVVGWRRSHGGNRPGRTPTGLILPHPAAHLRAFVLVPLMEVQPHWWHPALGAPAVRLLHRLPRSDVKSVLARHTATCDSANRTEASRSP